MNPVLIHGAPCDVWNDVLAAQHGPFISPPAMARKWMGQAPDSVEVLLDVLAREPLDIRTVHYMNCNCKHRKVFEYFGTRKEMS